MEVMVTRGELGKIYKQLTGEEKSLWAIQSGYKGYQGLYRYIRVKENEMATRKVVRGLYEVVGKERFENYIGNSVNVENETENMNELVNLVVLRILNSDNEELIRKVNKRIHNACVSRLLKLECDKY